MRIDKWLWAARFFKTRGLAARACDLGRVESNGITAKPAREIRLGDSLRIRTEAGEYTVDVLLLNEMRGPASVAQTMYREGDASREARERAIVDRKMMASIGLQPEHRPSKRERREIEHFRGRD